MTDFSKDYPPYSKRDSGRFISTLRHPLRWVLLGVLVYITCFAIVSQIYEHKMAQFNEKSMRVYSQLSAQDQEKALAFIPSTQTLFASEKPLLLNPSTVFFSLFSFAEIHSEGLKKLKLLTLAFKENLSEINLSELDLSGKEMDFSGANFSHANLTRVNFSNADLSGANLSGANLTEANLSDVNLIDAVLPGADLSRADLSRVTLMNADLSGSVLREARIIDADLSGVNLFFADLSGVILRESRLVGTDLSGVTLYHADLIGANLSRARLGGADLNGADFRYANLTHTIGLNQKQLDRGIVNERTLLPEGFRRSKMAQ